MLDLATPFIVTIAGHFYSFIYRLGHPCNHCHLHWFRVHRHRSFHLHHLPMVLGFSLRGTSDLQVSPLSFLKLPILKIILIL